MDLIIGIISGGILSWIITHFYYKKSNEKQNTQNELLSKKLSADVKKIILNNNANNLSIKDLNKLLEEKTIVLNSNDPLPFKACPKCGNTHLIRSTGINNREEDYYLIKCEKCGWNDWSQ